MEREIHVSRSHVMVLCEFVVLFCFFCLFIGLFCPGLGGGLSHCAVLKVGVGSAKKDV